MRCYFHVSACILAAAATTTPLPVNAFTMKTRPRHVHVYFLPSELPKEQDQPSSSESASASTSASASASASSISSTYVVIDVIRATTTMVHALSNGVGTLIPCETIEEAYKVKDFYRTSSSSSNTKMEEVVLLGGERQGVLIEGFDLSNSPKDYAREKVNGRVVGFTTTNGTKALMKCSNNSKNGGRTSTSNKIYIGAFCNLSAVARKILDDDDDDENSSDGGGPIHIVCAGSDGQVCGEDVLFAGALCEQLMLRQRQESDEKRSSECGNEESLSSSPFFFFEDSARIAMYQWKEETGGYGGYPDVHDDRSVQEDENGDEGSWNVGVAKQNLEGRLKQALRHTKGGRGLVALGPTYEDDLDIVAQIDTHDLVGVYQKQSQSPREDQDSSSGDEYRPSIIVAT